MGDVQGRAKYAPSLDREAHRSSVHGRQFQNDRPVDAVVGAQLVEQVGRRVVVDFQHHHRVALPAADHHVGDVDPGVAEFRADDADDARLIVVLHDHHRAGRDHIHVVAVDLAHARMHAVVDATDDAAWRRAVRGFAGDFDYDLFTATLVLLVDDRAQFDTALLGGVAPRQACVLLPVLPRQ